MPFPTTCAGALDHIAYYTDISYQAAYSSMAPLDEADVHWAANEDHLAIQDIILSVDYLRYAAQTGPLSINPFFPDGSVHWYLTNCITGYTLTMDAILSVMIAASDDEYKKFIGLVDAYRVGLWNKPFNSEYYAALARGFAQWG